jgi:hypothetical protein
MDAFGGEQLLTIENNFISSPKDAEMLGKFIIDNYSAPRDIPQITMKHPRPFLQVGDRVQNIDSYNGQTKEFIINNLDETYTAENVQMVIKLREADAGTGAYDPVGSFSESIVVNLTDYSKLQEAVDATKGTTSTEVKRDIYNMRGISWHGRTFDFSTGLYSGATPAPTIPLGSGIAESFSGELRTFTVPPTVIVVPLYAPQKTGASLEATTGFEAHPYYDGTLTTTQFKGFCQATGEGGIQNGWYQWFAIGETRTIT